MDNSIEKIQHKNFNFNQIQESKNDLLQPNTKKNVPICDVYALNIQNSKLSDVVLDVVIQIGTIKLKIKDLLQITPGTVLYLNKLRSEMLDILVNNILIAQGELVHYKDRYGIRIVKIIQYSSEIL